MNNPLNSRELKKVTEILNEFEKEAIGPIRKINGSFAIASMFNYDDEIVDVEIKYGIQDDTGSDVHTELFKICRIKMMLI